jgi:uncharacterized DUF497 family protein
VLRQAEKVTLGGLSVTPYILVVSHEEVRYYALGQSDAGRLLFVVYTLREDRARVISAREMTRRERKEYEHGRQELEGDSEI